MNSQESGSLGDIQQRFKLRVIHDALGLLICVVVRVGTNLGVALVELVSVLAAPAAFLPSPVAKPFALALSTLLSSEAASIVC
jgi:hypothetical protein